MNCKFSGRPVASKMGIKDLWPILTPFCERKPLYDLQGKVVAVDLSCWVCEAQNITEFQVQSRPYLRNLYFRTSYLLLMEVIPVFVLEGKAPELKYQTIASRNLVQFKGAKPKTGKNNTGKDRSRFHFVLKQCAEMLRCMGLACVQGTGEAECMCAHLNEEGLVAGCISQDSDCFAYGAKVVYRNFSISTQGSYAASGGAIDVYDIQKAKDLLKLGRNKIIALALLCGSDYNEGIHGVGRESAMRFFNRYEDDQILERIRSWRNDDYIYNQMENRVNDKNICTSCGHDGKVITHTKNGCKHCGTTAGCDFSKYREERLDIKNELAIRSKALSDPDFPNEEIINEYLIKKDEIKTLDLKWKQPDMIKFVNFTKKFLGWEEIYSFEKFLPIVTRWQLLNHKYIDECTENGRNNDIKGILFPEQIKKIRNPKGVPSFEIVWTDKNDYFKHLIPSEQLEKYKEDHKESLEGLWNTIEPKNLVENAHPRLVNEFYEKKNSKKVKKPSKRKPKNSVDEINELLQNTLISEPKTKKSRPKTIKKLQKNTLDKFINKENVNDKCSGGKRFILNEINSESLCDKNDLLKDSINETKTGGKNEVLLSENTVTVPIYKTKVNMLIEESKRDVLSNSFDFNASKFGDEDDMDISDVIDEIVNRKITLPKTLTDLGYKIQTPKKYPNDFYETNFRDEFEDYLKEKSDDSSELGFVMKNSSSPLKNNSTPLKNNSLPSEKSSLENISSPSEKSSLENNSSPSEKSLLENNSSPSEKSSLDNNSSPSKNLFPLKKYLSSVTNVSSFFDSNFNEDDDLFEKSLRKNFDSDLEGSGDDTIEYDVNEIKGTVSDDTSEEEYVPLIERLKLKKIN